jgi:hypothetical protein
VEVVGVQIVDQIVDQNAKSHGVEGVDDVGTWHSRVSEVGLGDDWEEVLYESEEHCHMDQGELASLVHLNDSDAPFAEMDVVESSEGQPGEVRALALGVPDAFVVGEPQDESLMVEQKKVAVSARMSSHLVLIEVVR